MTQALWIAAGIAAPAPAAPARGIVIVIGRATTQGRYEHRTWKARCHGMASMGRLFTPGIMATCVSSTLSQHLTAHLLHLLSDRVYTQAESA